MQLLIESYTDIEHQTVVVRKAERYALGLYHDYEFSNCRQKKINEPFLPRCMYISSQQLTMEKVKKEF